VAPCGLVSDAPIVVRSFPVVTPIGATEILVGSTLVAVGLALSVLKVKNVRLRIVLGAVLAAAVALWVVEYRRLRTTPSTSSNPGATYLADPKIVLDDDLTIGARGSQARPFTLSSQDALQIVVEGKAHADKGFHVYVMSPADFENFSKKRPFHHVPAFEGANVTSFSRIDILPEGAWSVVVENPENATNIVVHLRVVIDPS
jgi:hypothetical protein